MLFISSNISLVKHNADVGADIAKSLTYLQFQGGKKSVIVQSPGRRLSPNPQSRVVCVGGAVVDIIAKASPYIAATSNPGVIRRSGMFMLNFFLLHLVDVI